MREIASSSERPDLEKVKGLDSTAAVIAALWNHGFTMAERAERRQVAWPQFRPEEMAPLVAFLRSLRISEMTPVMFQDRLVLKKPEA